MQAWKAASGNVEAVLVVGGVPSLVCRRGGECCCWGASAVWYAVPEQAVNWVISHYIIACLIENIFLVWRCIFMQAICFMFVVVAKKWSCGCMAECGFLDENFVFLAR